MELNRPELGFSICYGVYDGGHDEPISFFLEQKVNAVRVKSCDM